MATIYNKGTDAENVELLNDTYDVIDKVARTDIYEARELNTLNGLYKGTLEEGKIYEQIMVALGIPYTFEQGSTSKMFTADDAGIKAKYFEKWNYEQSSKEIYDYKVLEMVRNGQTADEIGAHVVASLINGDNYKIFKDLKGLLLEAKEDMTAFEDTPTPATLQDLLLAIRDAISDFKFTNAKYHDATNFGDTSTSLDDVRIVIGSKLLNRINVVELANTLHIERKEMQNMFWEVDTEDNIVYIVDVNAIGYFTKNTAAYLERRRPMRKSIAYYDNDKMYYYSNAFKATYITYTPTQNNVGE